MIQNREWKKIGKNLSMTAASLFLLIEIGVVFLVPVFCGMNPYVIQKEAGFYCLPNFKYWMGTDAVGRDLFARLLYGGRVSILVGVSSVFISVLLGLPMGMIAGYYRGVYEMIIMRLADIFQSFPSMILILVLTTVFSHSVFMVVVIIGIMGWIPIGKLVYSKVLSIRSSEYIEAARAIGRNDFDILYHEILPNALDPVWIIVSFRVGSAILTESTLSFLGAGIQPPQASWGNMVYSAQDLNNMINRPWMWIPPGIMIILTVICFNTLGEGIRDALDPKMQTL
ncbi:MAG: ABC transporter permease [Treponema sp.]|jgi:peptide/nickel transport system permease protein|nr:ABC transporter permease [Treponema sp.]